MGLILVLLCVVVAFGQGDDTSGVQFEIPQQEQAESSSSVPATQTNGVGDAVSTSPVNVDDTSNVQFDIPQQPDQQTENSPQAVAPAPAPINWVTRLSGKVPTGTTPYIRFPAGVTSTWDEKNCVFMDGQASSGSNTIQNIDWYVLRFRPGFGIAEQQPKATNKTRNNRHRVLALRIAFEDPNSCGTTRAPERCQETCSLKQIQEVIFDGISSGQAQGRSARDFFSLATRNQVQIEAKVKDVMVRRGAPVFFSGLREFAQFIQNTGSFWCENEFPLLCHSAGDAETYDHVAFFLPENWVRTDAWLPVDNEQLTTVQKAGASSFDSMLVWQSGCDLEVFMHEFGHMLGLGHAGGTVKKQNMKINLWQDMSSIMGASIPYRLNQWNGLYQYRGLSSFELFNLGVLKADQILNVYGTRQNIELRSLSSNAASGVLAVRVQTKEGNVYWLEWREKINQDADLQRALCGSVVTGPLYDSLLIRHVPDLQGVRKEDLNGISTTVDAILTEDQATMLPLNGQAVQHPMEIPENVFVFHFKNFQQAADGGKILLLDVYDVREAPLPVRIVGITHQAMVMSEISVDGGDGMISPIQKQFLSLTVRALPTIAAPFCPSTTPSEEYEKCLGGILEQFMPRPGQDQNSFGLKAGTVIQQFLDNQGNNPAAIASFFQSMSNPSNIDTSSIEQNGAGFQGVNLDQNAIAAIQKGGPAVIR